jgi:hypothetical protein
LLQMEIFTMESLKMGLDMVKAVFNIKMVLSILDNFNLIEKMEMVLSIALRLNFYIGEIIEKISSMARE